MDGFISEHIWSELSKAPCLPWDSQCLEPLKHSNALPSDPLDPVLRWVSGEALRTCAIAALAQDSAPEGLETECGRMGRLATPIWAIPKEMTSNDNQSIPSTEEHKRQQHVSQQLC